MIRAPLPGDFLPKYLRAIAQKSGPVWFSLAASSIPARPEKWALACDPVRVVQGEEIAWLEDAWAEERSLWGNLSDRDLPIGVGYLSYDLGRRFERIRGIRSEESSWPGLEFRFYDAICGWENGTGEILARDEHALQRMLETLGASVGDPLPGPPMHWRESEPAAHHLQAVSKALDYIFAGDVYQVNLARRLVTLAHPSETLDLALALSQTTPAPFSFWFGGGPTGRALVGNSPERFLRLSPSGRVETCPIKGTRKRIPGVDPGPTVADLLASEKDRAEHVMIVDLERNDLGRVCQTGSVAVSSLLQVLSLPTVFHWVSVVEGQLRPEVGLEQLLRATFPGGSVTGAPKVRAMEIIDELEPACRGPYTGATGWLGAAGDLDLAVAIRTAAYAEGRFTLWVGGGIVADSVPEDELSETWAKASAFIRARGE